LGKSHLSGWMRGAWGGRPHFLVRRGMH
jgi:hypothetical protein